MKSSEKVRKTKNKTKSIFWPIILKQVLKGKFKFFQELNIFAVWLVLCFLCCVSPTNQGRQKTIYYPDPQFLT